ncbi:MAG: tripartite tricarboxylate transporter permease [Deltaproteobacteria bacterium]|nr:tripartite tricarboxylate transporter permease [Deltaproteobacteria bacterium]
MDIFNSLIDGLVLILQWKSIIYLSLGIVIGFCTGILPGLGGGTALALMLPFVFRMAPHEGIAFLLGMHAVLATTGELTSILFGIPGEPITIAMIMDGFPMAKKGEAGRAMGAALMSSLIGSFFGAFILIICIPIVRPLVLALGTPELLMVMVIGLTCIASLSGGKGKRNLVVGFLAGGIGFLFSLVGEDPQTGILRFTFGSLYLYNGIPLVPVVLGFFAIPELIDLRVRGTSIAGNIPIEGDLSKGVVQGLKDALRNFWLVIRCSTIGYGIGILPGLGGAVAQWVAYAHAAQSAKSAEERAGFGKGDVRGVIGPGSASNSKEGGGIIPTIAFGIPATPGMAVLMGGLLLMGLVPGPEMLTENLHLTFSMAWTIALSNFICVPACLLILNHLAKITTVRGSRILPILMVFVFIGAYSTNFKTGDLIVLMLSGLTGYFMVRFGLPRPPLFMGFIIGNLAEMYFGRSNAIYGSSWIYRPGVIVFALIAVGVALYPVLTDRMRKNTMGDRGGLHERN